MGDHTLEKQAQRIQEVFHGALDSPRDLRSAFLDRHCGSEPDIRREVESLLNAYDEADSILSWLDNLRDNQGVGGFASSDHTGEEISHYRIFEKLGGGGMGVVYRARDLRLDRLVALKFLPRYLISDERAKARFVHEAKAVSVLDHANICTIYDIDETEAGQLFIAMAFYESETLRKRMARGLIPIERAIEIGKQIARGLHAAHEACIVHRDVKPANVLLTWQTSLRTGELVQSQAKLIDFGISVILGEDVVGSPSAAGTAAYMSPEQALRAPADHRTDLWSLGVTLYEMLTGTRPFQGTSTKVILDSVVCDEPAPLRDTRPDVPARLAHVVNRLLQKDPEERYQDAVEVIAALQ